MAEEKLRYFQYLAGERRGEIVIFDKIEREDDIIFICFKDNSRCNEDLILPINSRNWNSMLMAEVENLKNVWTFKTEWVGREEEKWATNNDGEKVCVQPFIEGRKRVTPVPPKPTTSKFGNIITTSTQNFYIKDNQDSTKKVEEASPNEPEQPNKDQTITNDPVWLMLEKAKKFDTEISLDLTISLPAKNLYKVAKESFEGGDIKVVEYILHNLDNKVIKENLKVALLEAYEKSDNEGPTYLGQG